jgi:predicted nuclease of predicted toxin-antitoxin system
MRFLLDQSAHFRLAAFLHERAHDVTAIGKDYPSGLADEDVLAIAERERRILITSDLDFGELVVRYEAAHAGVILFRLDETDIELKRRWLGHLLDRYGDDLPDFIVITDRAIRARPQ